MTDIFTDEIPTESDWYYLRERTGLYLPLCFALLYDDGSWDHVPSMSSPCCISSADLLERFRIGPPVPSPQDAVRAKWILANIMNFEIHDNSIEYADRHTEPLFRGYLKGLGFSEAATPIEVIDNLIEATTGIVTEPPTLLDQLNADGKMLVHDANGWRIVDLDVALKRTE